MKKLLVILLLIPSLCFSSPPTRQNTYVSGTTIRAEDVTDNEDEIYGYLQTGVDTIRTAGLDAITEISSSLLSGSDGNLITGTEGTSGQLGFWNSDGDIVGTSGLTWTEASVALVTTGIITGWTVYIRSAKSCDTLDTDSTGKVVCGTDGGGGIGSPGGSDTQIQFNDASAFGGDSGFTYNKTTDSATLAGDLTITGDDIFMGTNTSGFIFVADGTNFNPVDMSGDIDISNTGATTIGSDKVVEADLKAVDSASDEEILTFESTTGDFEWETCVEITGSADLCDGSDANSGSATAYDDINDPDENSVIAFGTYSNTWTVAALDADFFKIDQTGNGSAANLVEIAGDDADISALLRVDNEGTGTIVTGVVVEVSASGVITDAFNAFDPDITNALNMGTNNIIGTTGIINLSNFDVSSGGEITVAAGTGIDTNGAGTLDVGVTNATTLTVGSSSMTSVTITTDGTGTGEIVLPNDSIGGAELSDFGTMTATSGNILVADGTDFESVAMSGDITIATGGATAIGASKVTSTMILNETVDAADDTNLTAGRSLTLTNDDVLADAELYTDAKCINIDPTASTTDWLMWKAPIAVTITGVDCIVDTGTSTVLTPQDCNSNGTSCANISSAAITCLTTNTTEAAFTDASVAAGNWIRVTRGTNTGATQAILCIEYTAND